MNRAEDQENERTDSVLAQTEIKILSNELLMEFLSKVNRNVGNEYLPPSISLSFPLGCGIGLEQRRRLASL